MSTDVMSATDKDSDNIPSMIHYEITSTSGCASFLKADQTVHSFSQQDINEYKIYIEEESSTSTLTSSSLIS